MGGIFLFQHAKARALEHRIGDHARSAGFQIVAFLAAAIDHLVIHAAFRVRVGGDALHHLSKQSADIIAVFALRQDFAQICQRCGKPSHRAQPKASRKAGDRIGPECGAACVIAVIIQLFLLVKHALAYGAHLTDDIAVIPFSKVLFIQRGKNLCHIDAIQPDLVGIDLLVPEAALVRAGLLF